ncbi:hypothetical protein [Halobaculum rubrum]|uniref:hypothetical protein n=1 Tax=Halobaculum rubrum TaxID=2872158 RepID=UPI001CA3E157|nr:hypothetical protein [Halobaculum rubrum]QZY01160.1 hypothetical protein K6T25_15335 [Halobaculum rubrum]
MLIDVTADGGSSTDRFVSVVSQIVSTSGWQHRGQGGAVGRAQQLVSGGPLTMHLQLPGVNADLELEYRPTAEAVCDVRLYTPLDPSLPHREVRSGFVGRLATAHNSIARKYTTSHLEPQTDPHVLLMGTVPRTAGRLSIQTMAAGLSAAALEAAWLHEQINSPVDEYLGERDRGDGR